MYSYPDISVRIPSIFIPNWEAANQISQYPKVILGHSNNSLLWNIYWENAHSEHFPIYWNRDWRSHSLLTGISPTSKRIVLAKIRAFMSNKRIQTWIDMFPRSMYFRPGFILLDINHIRLLSGHAWLAKAGNDKQTCWSDPCKRFISFLLIIKKNRKLSSTQTIALILCLKWSLAQISSQK